ncbi:peptidoglycan-binding protein [Ilumatobacter coccineus]|uniref:Putative cell wall hydrolase n=1 Tax=Ilumatobacter coccineus (strain NBRC 103263 / KCTC 29153 / YM16-304) TaxID=1313172 RepID=A0A6C7ECV4_ILUCY|nr:peptidoglycan-binding protein [Ilumatobacter coccineus]BAN04597.1 putative cell wall hydrolase [Ilumatobacter coccineus YM16-304]
MLTAPMLRGDDVTELQNGLNHLGFDCGRPDGIFGPATGRALDDFQRNSGLRADGICGQQTVRTIQLVSRQSGTGPGVASIRETEVFRVQASMSAQRVVVGQFGGLSSIARSVRRGLREAGANVMPTDEYEATAQAAAANRFGATVYLGLEALTERASTVSYFAVPSFESIGGRSLATQIVNALHGALDCPPELSGMRLPVLRETRMPAVLCSMGPVRDVIGASQEITDALIRAVVAWSDAPFIVADTASD